MESANDPTQLLSAVPSDFQDIAIRPYRNVDGERHVVFSERQDIGGLALCGDVETYTREPLRILSIDALVPKDELKCTYGIIYCRKRQMASRLQLSVEWPVGMLNTVGQDHTATPKLLPTG